MPAHPEALLISATIRTQDCATPLRGGITHKLFHVYEREWAWIEEYYQRRKKCPSREAFKHKFPDFRFIRVDDVEHLCDEVKAEHARHRTVTLIDEAIESLKGDQSIDKVVTSLHRGLVDLELQTSSAQEFGSLTDDWQTTFREVARRYERAQKHGMAGIPTGFPTLDNLTGGPQPGDYWVIGARLGQGKTWTLIRMACAALYEGHTVNYHALEQSRTQIEMRCHTFISSKYGKETFKGLDLMRGQNFDLLAYRKFLRNLKQTIKGTLYVSDTSRGYVTPFTLASMIERNNPTAVYVDYLTLMDQGDDWRATAKLSGSIKQLAQRYQVPIIVAAQINRSGAGKEPPGPEHLSSSDAIGQDADALVTLKQMSSHVIKFRLAKFRHGRDNEFWWCKFRPNTGDYEEISGDEALEVMAEDAEDGE